MNDNIAYCGLDCEKCDAYLATINNDDELRKRTAALWSELNGVTITPDQINCLGCRRDGVKTVYCQDLCKIRICAAKKGFATCGDCEKLVGCETVGMVVSNNKEALENLKNK